MKVALLSYTVDEVGGWGRVAVNLARALQRANIKCDIYTSEREICPSDVACKPVLKTSTDANKNMVYSVLDFIKLRNEMKEYDVVHAITETHMFLAYLLGRPYVLSTHGTYATRVFLNPLLHKLYQRVFKKAHQVVITSHFTRALIEKEVVIDNWIYIPNGVDTERFTVSPNHVHSPKTFITVGAIKPRKGQDLGVEALQILVKNHPEATYFIVGDTNNPMQQKLEQTIQKNGLEKNVVFEGRISDEELIELYNSVTVYVQPSRVDQAGSYEGAPLTLLEASACGIPIIGSDASAAAELIKDGYNGYLVPNDNAEGLASALKKIFENPEQAQKMGKNARLEAEKLSWSENAKQMTEIYKKTLVQNS